MLSRFPGDIEGPLIWGFAATAALWLAFSTYVILNRLLYDRRANRLADVARQLEDNVAVPATSESRQLTIDRVLARLSRRVVYHMVADVTMSQAVVEMVVAYVLDRWGLARIVRDASPRERLHKWRRVAALFALGRIRPDETHEILRQALFDTDPDVASAAVIVLHRLQDLRAAEILIAGLRARAYSPSRIATQLDQFTTPIVDLLRPLLADPLPDVRFWAVSLLARYPDAGLVAEIAALAHDPHAPVRKAVLQTLAVAGGPTAGPIAVEALEDAVAYIRSTAIRTLATVGTPDQEPAARREYARIIAPLLGDVAWDVRAAAIDALVAFGPAVWPEASAQLESPDRFARHGAAEVLQNLGLLDQLIDDLGHGLVPRGEMVRMLERALREGGAGIVAAAAARSDPVLFPSIDMLLKRLRVAGVRVS